MKKSAFSLPKLLTYLLINAAILALLAIGLTWFLEYRYFMLDASATNNFIFNRSAVFFYNAMIVWLFLIGFTAIIRRPFLVGGLSWAALIILTFVEMEKFSSRGTPLLPEDFLLASEATSLTQFVDIGSLIQTIAAAVLAVALGIYLEWLWQHFVTSHINLSVDRVKPSVGCENRPVSHFYIMRLVILSLSIISLVASTDFVRNHSGEKYQQVAFLNSELVAWNQTRNYDYNGFILGFLYNLQKFDLATPDNYSQEAIDKIISEYADIKSADESAAESGLARTSLTDADYNIIVILNESFYDPAVLDGYYNYASRDINSSESFAAALLPNLYKIAANYPHGQMYSLDYGGGTANIEFEADTGLTNYWIGTVPYTDLVPRTAAVPSIASFTKANGYQATAIHSYNGGMYKRNISLLKEGFDELIDDTKMQHQTKESDAAQYLNDQAIYNEALDLLNNRDSKQLISLITMQNHTPYDAEIYNDDLEFELTSPAVCADSQSVGQDCISAEEKRQIEVYLQSLHASDQYLGEFITALENSAEKTVVLFYGDHAAGLFNLTNNSDDKSVRDLNRLTPYFIYANFDLPITNLSHDNSASFVSNFYTSTATLPTTTPNCLTNSLYDILNVQKPTLTYLTAAVCSAEPILAPAYFESASPAADSLQDYQLVTYDILGGQQYSLQ